MNGLAFRIDKDTGSITFYDTMPVPTAADLLSPTFCEAGSVDAKRWLREQLALGPKCAKDLFEDGEQEGFTRAILYRAKKALGLRTRRISVEGRGAGRWEWSLT